jgi:hypothetical protein
MLSNMVIPRLNEWNGPANNCYATKMTTAKEWQLLAFFEVEPTTLDADVPWPYNNFTYRCTLSDVTVTFAVAPACKDFTLTVERGGAKEIELSALSVLDIRYHKDCGAEWLEILLTGVDRLELRLKPSFSLVGKLRPQA